MLENGGKGSWDYFARPLALVDFRHRLDDPDHQKTREPVLHETRPPISSSVQHLKPLRLQTCPLVFPQQMLKC